MIEAPSDSWSTLAVHLPEERACALTSAHVIASGLGRIWVDDPAHPSALASFTGGNLALVGRAENIRAGELWDLVGCLLEDWDRVFIDAQDGFAERLRDEVPGLHGWPRVAFELPESVAPERFESPEAISIRRLAPRDREALEGLGSGCRVDLRHPRRPAAPRLDRARVWRLPARSARLRRRQLLPGEPLRGARRDHRARLPRPRTQSGVRHRTDPRHPQPLSHPLLGHDPEQRLQPSGSPEARLPTRSRRDALAGGCTAAREPGARKSLGTYRALGTWRRYLSRGEAAGPAER